LFFFFFFFFRDDDDDDDDDEYAADFSLSLMMMFRFFAGRTLKGRV
jgi:hypothetical protein